MRLLKDYKGVALIYIMLTLINVVWLVSYERPEKLSQAKTERQVVFNA